MNKKYVIKRNIGITESPECLKKGLATHTINTGLLCGQGCKYCSTPSAVFRHKFFKEVGQEAFELFDKGVAVIDPWTPIRIKKTGHKLGKDTIVLFSTLTDPYAHEASEIDLGRRCIEAVLSTTESKIRIITKNVSILKDLELLQTHTDRISVGFSLTAPPEKENLIKILEPNSSSISERLTAWKAIHDAGIETFGVISPCLPGILTAPEDFNSILDAILPFKPTAVWVEPLTIKGNNLRRCSKEIKENGNQELSWLFDLLHEKKTFNEYIETLISTTTSCARQHQYLDKIKIIVNSDGDGFAVDDTAVIWLKR